MQGGCGRDGSYCLLQEQCMRSLLYSIERGGEVWVGGEWLEMGEQ